MIPQMLSPDENIVRKIKVIVADRHSLVREGLRHVLISQAEIEVVGLAGDGPEAVDLAARLQPDVVILDADLAGAQAAVQHLVTDTPEAGVLILAANGGVQRALNLLEAGATGYLCKSVTGHDLIAAVRHVSRGEMALGPATARQMLDHLTDPRSQEIDGDAVLCETLTDREAEVLQLLCQGHSDKEIAQKLYISVRTVGVHLHHIYDKLGVHSRTEAMHLALQRGWVSLSMAFPVILQHCYAL